MQQYQLLSCLLLQAHFIRITGLFEEKSLQSRGTVQSYSSEGYCILCKQVMLNKKAGYDIITVAQLLYVLSQSFRSSLRENRER